MTAPPPITTRRDDLWETIHGVPVADPYRWLEAGDAPAVHAWTAAQSARTEATLAALPGRPALEARLRQLLQVGSLGSPAVRGGRIFYTKRAGDQAQPVLCARDGLADDERVVVDPNRLDPDGLVALDWWGPSPDGQRIAYGTSRGGDEWSTLRVVEVATGEILPDAIPRPRYSSLAWQPDGWGSTARSAPLDARRRPPERRGVRARYYGAASRSAEQGGRDGGRLMATDEWYSPSAIIEPARRLMGGIDLDPASCETANRVVRAERFYGKRDDGPARPWRGREGIVAGWLEEPDEPGSWTFDHETPAVAGDLDVVRLDPAGRCTEFTEWWMEEK